jgi:hypothetical protein
MPDDGGWAYGANLDCMKELCAYWINDFDWRAQEQRINEFSHFIAPVAGARFISFTSEAAALRQCHSLFRMDSRVRLSNFSTSLNR